MVHDEAYSQAEKKIEEALKSGATTLDLRNMRLTELPELIKELKNLLVLDLGGNSWSSQKNQLDNLPEWIGDLRLLRQLDLSCNKLSELPESLGNIKYLRILLLSNNLSLEFKAP